ncbi:MAG: ABC transporter ATP-binding protein, partial [Candidatus Kapaibacteriota bacterium]
MTKFSSDEVEYKEFDWQLTKKLFTFVKPFKKHFFWALTLMLLTTILGPLRPYLSKIALDKYVLSSDSNGFILIVVLIFLVLVAHSFFQFLANYLMKRLGQFAIHRLRISLFNHIIKLDTSFFDKTPVGRLVTRVTNDIETISDILSGGLIVIITDIILIFAILVFMFALNFSLALITISVLPLLFVVTWIFRNKVRKIFRLIRQSVAKLNAFLNEFISGIFTIKIFNREYMFNLKFDKINCENRDLWIKTINYYAIFFPTIEFLSSVSLGLIIWYTAESILSGRMTIGTFFAFIQYAEMFYRPIRDLSEKFTNLQNAMASSERIFQIFETSKNIEVSQGARIFNGLEKTIEFKNVSFSYDGENEVLHNINFTIYKGETVAIVGHTGAGKTTLINLLCRFYNPTSGEILFDGVNINEFDLASLREKIALVSQDVFLFSRNILENLTLGSELMSYDKIIEATSQIGSLNFIDKLPEKFYTNVIEKGITLSSGQRQLIAFTRAIIR